MIDYDPHRWRDHLLSVKGSVLRKVVPRVLVVVIWAVVVCVLDRYSVITARFPATAHSLVGVALGLLLVFRTNASYDRFWEARRQWGAIVNASRNLARGAAAFMTSAQAMRDRTTDWTAAFPYSVMNRLRAVGGFGLAEEWLPAESKSAIASTANGPLLAATQISTAIAEARRQGTITDYEQMLMDTQVAALIDAAGACDRIHKTPLPFAYVVHLRYALVSYLGTLPFALHEFGWCEVVVMLMVSFVLLGIEEIGVEIEDPFGTDDNDLPLEAYCAAIAKDIRGATKAASA